jgi:hypothetical protein
MDDPPLDRLLVFGGSKTHRRSPPDRSVEMNSPPRLTREFSVYTEAVSSSGIGIRAGRMAGQEIVDLEAFLDQVKPLFPGVGALLGLLRERCYFRKRVATRPSDLWGEWHIIHCRKWLDRPKGRLLLDRPLPAPDVVDFSL